MGPAPFLAIHNADQMRSRLRIPTVTNVTMVTTANSLATGTAYQGQVKLIFKIKELDLVYLSYKQDGGEETQ